MHITKITCGSMEHDSRTLDELYTYRSVSAADAADTSEGMMSDAQKMLMGILLLSSLMALALLSRRKGGRTE